MMRPYDFDTWRILEYLFDSMRSRHSWWTLQHSTVMYQRAKHAPQFGAN